QQPKTALGILRGSVRSGKRIHFRLACLCRGGICCGHGCDSCSPPGKPTISAEVGVGSSTQLPALPREADRGVSGDCQSALPGMPQASVGEPERGTCGERTDQRLTVRRALIALNLLVATASSALLVYTFIARDHVIRLAEDYVIEKTVHHASP